MTHLRWVTLCTKNGVKTQPVLLYWDKDRGEWVEIDYVEYKIWEYNSSDDPPTK